MENQHAAGDVVSKGKMRQARYTLLILVLLVAGAQGCTRTFYRNSADREVNDILAEKNKYSEWQLEQFHVYPDNRARFADPTNPDHPPMPPDDEATDKMSPHPQAPGKAGVAAVEGTAYLEMIKLWDEQNRTARPGVIATEESDEGSKTGGKGPVQDYFEEPLNTELKGFLLNMDQATELGVINSPNYQTIREDLYLAALPVTQQRFNFAYQWAAIADWIRQFAGPQAPGGPQNNWTGNSAIGFTKLFSTGALLTLDFTNSTVFNFTGPQGLVSASTINVNAVQPLLQGGGKAVTLEPLTAAERNLFYSMRAFARFREEFAVDVALGTALPNDLAAITGIGNGTNPISVLAALGIASTDVSGGFVGYLSTLFRECDMAADKKWAADLERALQILEGYQEGGMFSPLQVDQVRSTLLQAQNTVLTDKQFVINALDQFKLVLGLPANLPLILDDTAARPITRQYDRYYKVIADSDKAYKSIEKQDKLPAEKLRAFLQNAYVTDPIVRGTPFQKKISGSWESWAKETNIKARVDKLSEERRKLLDLKTDLNLNGKTLAAEDVARLHDLDFEVDLGGLEQTLRRYEAKPWEKFAKKELADQERTRLFRLVVHAAQYVLVWARNERFDHVTELWAELPETHFEGMDMVRDDVDLAQEVVVKAGLANRWDLMNARAQVVDAWRQIRVTANALLGVLNVGYNGQIQTNPNGTHPLAFTPAASTNQLTLNFQLPLNRLAQRNNYRTAQINYQVARRNLEILEDNIAAQLRFDVRQLQLFANNYRIQKKVIQSLYSQVESALEVIVAPADPDQLKASGTTGQANAAALTSQYLTALSGLNGAQTKMYDIWLSFYATRMQLALDLERLPINERGIWTGEFGTSTEFKAPAPAPETGQAPSTPTVRGAMATTKLSDGSDIPLVYINHPFYRTTK